MTSQHYHTSAHIDAVTGPENGSNALLRYAPTDAVNSLQPGRGGARLARIIHQRQCETCLEQIDGTSVADLYRAVLCHDLAHQLEREHDGNSYS